MSEDGREESQKSPNDELISIVVENRPIVKTKSDERIIEKTEAGDGNQQHVEIKIESNEDSKNTKNLEQNNETVAEILINKPLCADYDSSSDTESDSDSSSSSDSDTSSVDSDSDSSSQSSLEDLREICDELEGRKKSEKKDGNIDLDIIDLPPIENLRISVPEEECQEIGTISSIVDTLVVVQAYKGTPALDLDTVLFLDTGKKSLGRIFDVLGPVSEPVYTVRFNNIVEITENNITKGDKVYCAPKTEYTSFVFVSELMKMKGSDASWKNNEEVPPECLDFSDDEEERKNKYGEKSSQRSDNHENGCRKRKIHGKSPRRGTNYRNPFALDHSRSQRFNPNFRYSHPNPPQYPENNNPHQFYNNYGGMMRPQFPMYSAFNYYSQPMQQFAMPPVMPPPPPPPSSTVQQSYNHSSRSPWVFGRNIENPSQKN